jgi:large subunit ribosomal protein L28
MSRVCDMCGKGPMTGNRIVRHGLAKYKGGIGLHTTGITQRRFLPNLRSIRMGPIPVRSRFARPASRAPILSRLDGV